MLLLFYISLTRALNLQERFMIFQRREGSLRNFILIKQNSIKE
uniref:Ribosomal protein S16 n=1 Tax=Dodonaea viscosa TaxID=151065 RepID=A0A291F6I7_DODVI|nr:ribosomal protein S16 [Dodonaea viscosa]ATG27777.1 ribosomal protein S16 [Dodonaea viscosa]